MKRVIFAEFGGPEVLQLVDAEEPHAGPGEVRIAVRAAGVNPADWRVRQGQVLAAHPTELPAGVGLDASGVVDEFGHVDAALDLAGSGVIRELVELAGDPQKVISIADLGAPEFGVRFSGVAGSVRKLHIPVERSYPLAEAAAAHVDSHAGHTRGRRVMVV